MLWSTCSHVLLLSAVQLPCSFTLALFCHVCVLLVRAVGKVSWLNAVLNAVFTKSS